MKKLLIGLLILSVFACEKDINPDLGEPIRALVVDAWLNARDTVQQISITRSQSYFDNTFPTKVSGATVFVIDSDGNRYDFEEGDSTYIWRSTNGLAIGEQGFFYILTVIVDGFTYNAEAIIGRVPDIDSVFFNFRPADAFITQDWYAAEFMARDLPGQGDTYWIKAWKNGRFLDKPVEINVAFDAGFSAGGPVDGIPFILPIRQAINPQDIVNSEFLPPYLEGDSVYVEIHSIGLPAFVFFQEVIIQTNRAGGFGALFAQPLANVSTNIIPQVRNAPKVVGFFNVARISSGGRLLTPEHAAAAKERFERERL